MTLDQLSNIMWTEMPLSTTFFKVEVFSQTDALYHFKHEIFKFQIRMIFSDLDPA